MLMAQGSLTFGLPWIALYIGQLDLHLVRRGMQYSSTYASNA